MATLDNSLQPSPSDESLPGETGSSNETLESSNTNENDITPGEIALLDTAGVNESEEDEDTVLANAQLDNVDDDGEPLNETTGLSGDDLDVPGSDLDDDTELTGDEDEENNSFSTTDQDDGDDDL